MEHGMWGEGEFEPEVRDWVEALSDETFQRVATHIDRLAQRGALLGEPATRQLDGKLRELRCVIDAGNPVRITYWIASGRRIVLLTVFRKTQRKERAEIDRARRVMDLCMAEGHTAEEET